MSNMAVGGLHLMAGETLIPHQHYDSNVYPCSGRFIQKMNRGFQITLSMGILIRGLPISSESCKAIYCSHVLEHLSLEDFRSALLNTYAALQTDGIFRLVLPDLEYYAKKYIDNSSTNAALLFIVKETSLGLETKKVQFGWFFFDLARDSQHF